MFHFRVIYNKSYKNKYIYNYLSFCNILINALKLYLLQKEIINSLYDTNIFLFAIIFLIITICY